MMSICSCSVLSLMLMFWVFSYGRRRMKLCRESFWVDFGQTPQARVPFVAQQYFSFTSTIWKGHQNAFALFDYSGYDLQNENFSFLMLGSNGKTQIGTEYIYMNINSLLSAIGGNLGMFLGFSVFSIYQIISNKLRSLL